MEKRPDYILFIDETGDHTVSVSDDLGKRYLGIAGPFLRVSSIPDMEEMLNQLKRLHLPWHDGKLPVLHRKEIMQSRGPFSCLGFPGKRQAFDEDLVSVLRNAPYKLLSVVIDKNRHGSKSYRRPIHPYHYCLHALLERYCRYLEACGGTGHVIAETRGREEDHLLRESYRGVYESGTTYLLRGIAKKTLFAPAIEIRKKKENLAGLQLADMLAHPATRDVLLSYKRIDNPGSAFTSRLVDAIKLRYYRKWDGQINGYGRVLLS